MPQYTIGIDLGSLSGRAVLVDTENGREVASAQMDYPHGCMDRRMFWGEAVPEGFVLQHPQDYLDVLARILPEITAGTDAAKIIGVGIDCTASTVLPVDEQGTPLCLQEPFCRDMYAYAMMWKHHGACGQARRMTALAMERGEPWLPYYGNTVDAEWMAPKLLELLEEAPRVYHAMAHFMEVSEWLAWRMTGRYARSKACLSYKAFYRNGFPDREYCKALNPLFENAMEEKLSGPICALGQATGLLTADAAKQYGLLPGTPVAAGSIDAHASVPAAGIYGPRKLLCIIGTSTCHMVMGEKALPVPGISGVVQDGLTPGYATYEAGQCCVGDHFHWYEQYGVPGYIQREAEKRALPTQGYLTELASRLRPGQSGLLALDWWNGNRSVLQDVNLSGMMMGMTLQTRPEEIYRALLEATAYGARVILENYRQHGVEVDSVYMTGGVSQKNPLAMQIYADVLNMPLHTVRAFQGPALGSAIFAAVAGGAYGDIGQATRAMGGETKVSYTPDPQAVAVYDKLYAEYRSLHDWFGCGGNDVMKRLKAMKAGGGAK